MDLRSPLLTLGNLGVERMADLKPLGKRSNGHVTISQLATHWDKFLMQMMTRPSRAFGGRGQAEVWSVGERIGSGIHTDLTTPYWLGEFGTQGSRAPISSVDGATTAKARGRVTLSDSRWRRRSSNSGTGRNISNSGSLSLTLSNWLLTFAS